MPLVQERRRNGFAVSGSVDLGRLGLGGCVGVGVGV